MTSSALLVTAAQAGLRAEDFDAIVTEHQRKIFRVVLALVRDAEVANTLTQDCFVRAYQHRESFRGEASVSTWLMRIAINLARDYQRSGRQRFWRRIFANSGSEEHERAAGALPSTCPTPEQSALAKEQCETVWRIVGQLSDRQREVFTLRFAEEMDLEGIATVLNMRVGTVKAHLARALASVRKELKVTP